LQKVRHEGEETVSTFVLKRKREWPSRGGQQKGGSIGEFSWRSSGNEELESDEKNEGAKECNAKKGKGVNANEYSISKSNMWETK